LVLFSFEPCLIYAFIVDAVIQIFAITVLGLKIAIRAERERHIIGVCPDGIEEVAVLVDVLSEPVVTVCQGIKLGIQLYVIHHSLVKSSDAFGVIQINAKI
jgi:hypothetical protein